MIIAILKASDLKYLQKSSEIIHYHQGIKTMDRVDLIESLTQKEIDIRFHYPHSSKLIRIRETVLALEAGKPIEEKASALLEELDGKSAFVTAAENVRSIMSQRKNETSYTKPSFQHNVLDRKSVV